MKGNYVSPISQMADVFVLQEKLRCALEELRSEMVEHPNECPIEIHHARRHARALDRELQSIQQYLRSIEYSKMMKQVPEIEPDPPQPQPEPPQPNPPKGPPDLKLVG